MSYARLQALGLLLLLLGLSGCNQSVDEQIASGLQMTEKVFAEEPEAYTDKIGQIQLFYRQSSKLRIVQMPIIF